MPRLLYPFLRLSDVQVVFHILAIVNSAAVNTWGACVFLNDGFYSMLSGGIAGSHGRSVLVFSESSAVLVVAVSQFTFLQQCKAVPLFAALLRHLLFVDFVMMTVLTRVPRYSFQA